MSEGSVNGKLWPGMVAVTAIICSAVNVFNLDKCLYLAWSVLQKHIITSQAWTPFGEGDHSGLKREAEHIFKID